MLTIPLHCFLNDKNIFRINFTCSLTFQWKLLVMAKHGELFESKILVYVQPLITRLCPLHVHKHGFIVHNCFITINCWSAVHYDISLKKTYILWWYTILLREILLQRSLARTISWQDIAKIVPISRWFIVLHSAILAMFRWYISDISQEQSAIFVDYRLHYFCTVLYFGYPGCWLSELIKQTFK